MRKQIMKFLGGLVLVAMLLNLAPFSTMAHAAAVTISISGITNHSGSSLSAGAYVQVVQSSDATKGAPGSNGAPAGDTVVTTSTINPDGTFAGGASISSGNYIYIRAWESWDGTGSPTAGTYYGDSAAENVGAGFVYVYDAAGFSTNKQTAVPQATITRSPTTISRSVQEGSNASSASFTVGNSGDATLTYDVSESVPWIASINPDSGTVNAGAGNNSHTITFATTSLTVGTHNTNITITDTGGNASNSPQTIAVSVTVNAVPQPTVTGINPPSGQQGQTLNVTISGSDTTWSGNMASAVHFSGTGITINSATGNENSISASINISAGAATSARTVTVDGAQGSATFNITAAPTPVLSATPTSLTFNAVEGGANPSNQTISISNAGTGTLSWNASDNRAWISINPTSGSDTGTIAVSINTTELTAASSPYTGTISITSNGGNQNVSVTLNITEPDQPSLSVAPTSLSFTATEGGANPVDQTLAITNAGAGTLSWDADNVETWLTIAPTSGGAGNDITASVDITGLSEGDYTDTISITSNGGDQNIAVSLSVGPSSATDPIISGISVASAEAGETIVITGTNFGDYSQGDSLVTFGTTPVNPTSWSDTEIILSVPTGLSTGEIDVTVSTTGGNSLPQAITIAGNSIYIDDFEGGCVGTWTIDADDSGDADSGYYAFGTGVTPDNSTITTDGPAAEALLEGARGMKVMYSYLSDWGGGWGAALANTLDLTSAEAIQLAIRWDGSTNDLKLGLKDSDGTAVAATISNATLAGLTGYTVISKNVADFEDDLDGSDASSDGTFDWSKVVSYNVVYNTNGTSTTYQYIDNIMADLPGGDDDDDDDITGLHIEEIDPPVGPAGTRILITGESFGATQGLSKLHFEKTAARTVYEAEIVSWSNASLEVIVPRTAAAGDYTVKVIKMTVAAAADGITTVQESNPEAFRVTASSATEGGLATIYPNPFNPLASGTGVGMHTSGMQAATVAFNPGSATNIGIYIYDMTAKMVYRKMVTSTSQISWDGRDDAGRMLGDGAYILRIIDEDSKRLIAKGKILIVKQ